MAKLSFYLDSRKPGADGRSPLTLTVKHNYNSARISLGIKMTPNDWEEVQYTLRNLPRSKWDIMSDDVYAMKISYDSALSRLEKEEDIRELSATDVRNRLDEMIKGESRATRKKRLERKKNLFAARYRAFAESKDTDGTRKIYLWSLKKIAEYDSGYESLSFEDINKEWLTGFDNYLKPTVCANIRNMYFRNIRAVFNDALKDEITTAYPFRTFRLPKTEETKKRALSLEQIKLLKDFPCDSWQEEYRDMFMLMIYLIGINAADLFKAKPEDLVDGRLNYKRDKTHKLYSVKVEPEAMAIINKYRGKDWLLSPLDRYCSYKAYLGHMNKALKKIGLFYRTSGEKKGRALFPDLSSYWSRHSWASLASQLDIPTDIIGRSLGHSWATDTVTAIYIKFDNRKVDNANRKVIDAIMN